MIKTLLLVFFILDGEGYNFAVDVKSPAECIVMQTKTGAILAEVLKRPPQFFASSCAEVKPYLIAS